MACLGGHKDVSLIEVNAVDEGHGGGLDLVFGEELLEVDFPEDFLLLYPPVN